MQIKAILIGMLFVSPLFAAETYYIDSHLGSDRWSGKFPDPVTVTCSTGTTCNDGPWKSLYIISTSSLTLRGGDSVLLRRGRVWKGSICELASGTPGAPLQLGSYGVGNTP